MALSPSLISVLLLLAPAIHGVLGQPGFLSIDCGLDASSSGYKSENTGIFYVPDGAYTDSGENHRIAREFESDYYRELYTLRSFPSGKRNCYSLPTVAGTKYLARAVFVYGNYDGKNSSSLEFDMHLGGTYWLTVSPQHNVYEVIFIAWAAWTPVCLIDTSAGTPFVSEVSLRTLDAALYPVMSPGMLMSLYIRRHMGAGTSVIRYPGDQYDRYWWAMWETNQVWVNLSTPNTIKTESSFAAPVSILQMATATISNNTPLTITWEENRSTYTSFTVILHFADFQNTQLRQFTAYINRDQSGPSFKPYSPRFLEADSLHNTNPYTATDGNYDITLVPSATSVLPPMLNAFELYNTLQIGSTTFPKDFEAIMAIKFEYGVKKNWMGDPCFPINYIWDGVKCSISSDNTTRITSVNLSSTYLHGTISKNFTLLTALKNLDLSYNNLSGSIPDSLLSLPSLQVLNVSGNDLSGDSICKNYTGSLTFRYESNGNCDIPPKSSPLKNKAFVIAISVVVPFIVVALLVLGYFVWLWKRKHTASKDNSTTDLPLGNALQSSKSHGDLQLNENRRFTYKDLKKFTDNFKQLLGKGGFGLVYYGRLENDHEVAVKLRSESSSHGLDEFLAEAQSLAKVHHRNLVSLIGYCWDKDHLALVYEYMSQGSLFDHLRGKRGGDAGYINWRTRLRIMLEAAQGLEYLHKGCSLPIVHRDVKTSNILLDQNLQAKIADFGLCKTYLSDTQTHISATAAGTVGYMDPEYYLTGRVNERSDVYSFGVVLLEAITGELPIVPGDGHIVQRVRQKINNCDISSVADARFGGAYDISSMWKVVDVAMMCTMDSATGRPTMGNVVIQLKESLALEEAREEDNISKENIRSDMESLVSTFHQLEKPSI